jgi:hypothetical protein
MNPDATEFEPLAASDLLGSCLARHIIFERHFAEPMVIQSIDAFKMLGKLLSFQLALPLTGAQSILTNVKTKGRLSKIAHRPDYCVMLQS